MRSTILAFGAVLASACGADPFVRGTDNGRPSTAPQLTEGAFSPHSVPSDRAAERGPRAVDEQDIDTFESDIFEDVRGSLTHDQISAMIASARADLASNVSEEMALVTQWAECGRYTEGVELTGSDCATCADYVIDYVYRGIEPPEDPELVLSDLQQCLFFEEVSQIPPGDARGRQFEGEYISVTGSLMSCHPCSRDGDRAGCDDSVFDLFKNNLVEVRQTDGGIQIIGQGFIAEGGVNADGSFAAGAISTRTDDNTGTTADLSLTLLRGQFAPDRMVLSMVVRGKFNPRGDYFDNQEDSAILYDRLDDPN